MDRLMLIEKAKELASERVTSAMGMDEKMDVLEMAMMELLDIQIMKPPLGKVGTVGAGGHPKAQGTWLMGDDPRLPVMPEKPTLMDFFRHRFLLDTVGGNHLLQSANLALEKNLPEKIVLACLLHDISVTSLIRNDHGHWAAQLIEPYVDPEVTWAVRHHQALRFKPSPKHGYEYPRLYMMAFGEAYTPPDYILEEWAYCEAHEWYESAMAVVVNDFYAFDPDKKIDVGIFEGIVDRNFRQPEEGLGFDRSPVAHMWRTMIWPNNFL